MHKIKTKKYSEFGRSRMIFFAEMPKLREGALDSVKQKKEAEGPELDVAGLVNESNRIIDGYTAQLNQLPIEFNQMLHNEIVKYFLASPGRYEKDENKGLSAAEFGAYRTDMVNKVSALMKEYAPTEEDLKAVKETKEGAESAKGQAEKVEPLDVKDVTDSPGQINDLYALNDGFSKYAGWNAALQQEGAEVIKTSGTFQQAYAKYEKARKGVRAYKQFMAYLWPEEDQERIALQNKLTEAKSKVAAAISKFEATKEKLAKHGTALGEVSNRLKKEKMSERDEKIREVENTTNQTAESKKAKEQQYKNLEERKKEMESSRDNLVNYREKIGESKKEFKDKAEVAENKKDQLTEFNGALESAVERIDNALANPDLPPETRAQLEHTRQQLEGKKNEADAGLNAANKIVEGGAQTVVLLEGAEKEAAERTLNLNTHIDQQVNPAIDGLDASIANLDTAKMQFATTKEQVNAHYQKAFEQYDSIDSAVDGAVLQNNLANESMLSSLRSQQGALNSANLSPPKGELGAIEATIGVPFSILGGAISIAGEELLDQATWLSKSLENARNEMGTFSYVAARIGVELVSTPIGVAGGLVEMAGGILTLAAHPIDTVKGLGVLVGTNPDVSAGDAWKSMGHALISYEDFKAGRIGVGVGKLFANVVTTATGAGALGAGGSGAKAAYIGARTGSATVAPVSVTRAMARAGVAGARDSAVYVGSAVKSAAALPGKIAHRTTDAARKAAARAKGKKTAAAAKVDDIGEGATELAKRESRSFEYADTELPGTIKKTKKTVDDHKPMELRNFMDEPKGSVDVGKNIDSYNSYRALETKIRTENPGIADDAIKMKIEAEHPGLIAAARQFEDSFNKMIKTTPEMAEDITAVNRRIQTTEELWQVVQDVKDGNAPLTTAVMDELFTTRNGMKYLEEIIKNESGKVQIESSIRAAELAKKVDEARALEKLISADQNLFYAFRLTTQQPADQMARIEESLRRVLQGKELPTDDDLARVFQNLSKRDPEAFRILENSRLDDLLENGLVDSLIKGSTIKVRAPDGSIRQLFVGKEAGRGGGGVATYVVYENNGNAYKAAYKVPHDDPDIRWAFAKEQRGAAMVTSWDHPHIMRHLEVGERYILYETGNDVKTLVEVSRHGRVDDWMRAYGEMVNGTLYYWNKGYFHGDLKEANVVTYLEHMEGKTRRATKILDNNPISFEIAGDVNWARTPGRYFSKSEVAEASRVIMRKTASVEETNMWLGRAQDVRAHGEMLRRFVQERINPAVKNTAEARQRHKHLHDLLEGTKNPLTAGEKGYLERLSASLQDLTDELGLTRSGREMPQTAPATLPRSESSIPPTAHNRGRNTVAGNEEISMPATQPGGKRGRGQRKTEGTGTENTVRDIPM